MNRILIVKISSLGDIIHAFPAVALLKKECPDSKIDWLVNPAFAGALKYCAGIRQIIPFPRKELSHIGSFFPAFFGTIGELRNKKYDIVIDFQGLMRSAFFAWSTGAGRIAGFKCPKEKPAKFLYSENFEIEPEFVHAIEKNTRLVSKLLGTEFSIMLEDLPVIDDSREKALGILGSAGFAPGKPFAAIAPGARWESKKWPTSFFAEVVKKVLASDKNAKFAVLGTESDSGDASAIMEAVPGNSIANLCGKTGMGELFEILRLSRCLLSNDSGPVHIAAALKTPVIALFGPTIPAKTGPYGQIHRVFQPDLDCIGCLSRYCTKHTQECHSGIDSGAVADAMLGLMKH